MGKLSLKLFFAAAVVIAAAACADREDLDTAALENKSFKAWVQKYLTDKGVEVALQDNGMYVEFLNEVTAGNALAPADTIVWVRINYTATTLFNDVFVTRSESEALKQGSYTLYTYYAPDYIFCGEENQSMIPGQYFALRAQDLKKPDGSTTKLREGSKVRLYMPSSLAFGSAGYSDDQGYGGQYSLSGTIPIIEELEIVEVVKNPITREENLVHRLAQDEWGLSEERDTVVTCLYIDSVSFKDTPDYSKYTDFKPNFDKFQPEYALTADSTAKIWFVARFLDDDRFIFDTNIEPIYNDFHKRQPGYLPDAKTHTVMTYTPESDKDSEIAAFYHAIPAMRRGLWYRIVFPSSYGYGVTGQSKALQDYYNYYDQLMNYYYSSSYYGSGYGSSYYNSYDYNSYYSGYNDYYNYSISSTTEDNSIVTEVQPYTPIILEIYIEPEED